MDKTMKKTLTGVIIIGIVSVGIITAFSIPLGIIPPLGDFLFPGDGIWNMDDEVASKETLRIPELSDEVTVYRDQWGIPHIYGENELDIVFVLGYVQAQDRLFQMDMARRLTQGRLAEILGPSSVKSDKFNLNMMKQYWTEKTDEQMKNSNDPEIREFYSILQSYSNGINYFINHCKELPLEFLFIDYTPEMWTPADTLGFIKYMSEMLTWSYTDFENLLIQDNVGYESYSKFFDYPLSYQIPISPDYGEFVDIQKPTSEFNDETIVEMNYKIDSTIIDIFSDFQSGLQSMPTELERMESKEIIGSNNWVVSGSKTETGKPLLCNDMHLSFNLPGIWYEAHLVDQSQGSDFSVYGFFLAGVPYPIVGHNAFVGWGMTNTAFDVMDWYYYDGINETHYYYKGNPTKYSTAEYEIPVKGAASEEFTVKSTIHGPVFNDTFTGTDTVDLPNKVIACKWIAQSITKEAKAIYKFSHAKNRADFDEASRYFSTPAQNIVYADIQGTIAIRSTGKVPIRNDTNIPNWHRGNGTMPYNGSAGEGEWIDYVPFEDLPHSENPDQGYLTSANQIVAGPEYLLNYTLQNPQELSNGYRARRLNYLLATQSDFSMADMKTMQLDIHSVKAENLTHYLLDVLAAQELEGTDLEVYGILQSWNFQMDKDLAAPTIFNVWFQRLKWLTLTDDEEHYYLSDISDSRFEQLIHEDSNSILFDNIHTATIENRNTTMLSAFYDSISVIVSYFGTIDPSHWLWGELHQIRVPHLTGFSALGYGPVPVSGTGHTVSPYSLRNLWGFNDIRKSVGGHGSSERLIVDFSNLDNSISVIPSGERGISNSIHYIDQLEMFLSGEYHTQYFGANTVTKFKEEWIESVIYFKTGGS